MPDPTPGATGLGGSTTASVPMEDEDEDAESSTGSSPVDLGSDAPAPECASISQSTDIVERPSDIIVIADDDVSRQFLQDNITNLLPGMETEQDVVREPHGGEPGGVMDVWTFAGGRWWQRNGWPQKHFDLNYIYSHFSPSPGCRSWSAAASRALREQGR